MKLKIYPNVFQFLLLFPLLSLAQVGVNTTAPSAMLDVSSTNSGVLVPRIALTSATDIATVVNPQGGALVASTLIYNTATAGVSPDHVTPGFYYWDGARWMAIGGTKDWTLNGNVAVTSPAIPAAYGVSSVGTAENFIGTTDNNDVVIGTNNIERIRVERTTGDVGIGTANPFYPLHVTSNTPGDWSIYSENTYVGDADGRGIFGRAVNNPGYGYGGYFEGGYMAGRFVNPGTNYSGTSYGIYSTATGNVAIGTRIGGYFSASGGFSNYGIIVPAAGGDVGIGMNAPLYKLNVEDNVNVVNSSVALFDNVATGAIVGRALSARATNGNPGTGTGGYFEGGNVGVRAANIATTYSGTSYGLQATATGTNATLGTRVAGYFSATGALNNYAIVVPGTGGDVGIGTTAPTEKLHVNGSVRIVDGTQGNGKVLTSNATGVASWQEIGIDNVVGVLSASGVNIPYTQTGPFLQTGSYIILPPGKYAVNVTMLLSKAVLTYSPNNSFFWVRSTFSNSAGANPTPSPDIIGSNLASGNFPGSSIYALLSGTIIINNTSGVNRTYYYVAGNVVANNTTETLAFFGGSAWLENNIIAYRLN